MNPSLLLLAAYIITSPIDATKVNADLIPALRVVALELEILDPREHRYVLLEPNYLPADLKLLRERWEKLRDAPLLADVERWPKRELVVQFMADNRAMRADLTQRLLLDSIHHEEISETIGELNRLYEIWDAVRDAGCDYYYISVRREALQNLRQRIGDEAYFSGSLPPHVPLWRVPVRP